jgi:hypothetical protein
VKAKKQLLSKTCMKTKFALICSLVVLTISATAANRYWVGPSFTSTNDWSTSSNWSATSGGSGGASVPGASDIAYFDTNKGPCALSANVTVGGLILSGAFASIIDIKVYTLTVSTSSSATLSKGTIYSTSSTSPGTLSFSNAGTITFSGTVVSVAISGTAANIFFNGSVFNNNIALSKTGTGTDNGTGGNTFYGTVGLSNDCYFASPASELLLGTSTPDTFNNDVTISTSSYGNITLAAKSTGNQFKGNLKFVNTSTASTISIGSTASSCSSTLANGKTLSNDSFVGGTLKLYSFTQSGTTAQTLSISSGARLVIGSAGFGCSFNGPVTFSAPILQINSSTFNSTSSFTQNGSSSDSGGVSEGGNTFNGDATFYNSGINAITLANSSGDTFNANATYKRGSNALGFSPMASSTSTNTYNGNLTLETNSTFAFSGTVQFTGSTNQTIDDPLSFSAPFAFNNITVKKSAGVLNQNVPITISSTLTLSSGIVKVNTSFFFTNYMNFLSGATVSDASNVSYVDGQVSKTGNTAFTFPVGNGGVARAISISAPALNTDVFTAQFFRSAQPLRKTMESTLATISNCEYWTLYRSNGTSNVSVTLSWNTSECNSSQSRYINTLTDLRVSRWDSKLAKWVDHGNGATTGTTASGTVTSSAAITSFSQFVLASSSAINPLPIVLKDFRASLVGASVKLWWETASEINNDHFTIERSENGTDFYEITQVKGAGNKSTPTVYTHWDERAAAGISYYRLKQTDFDGTTTYLGIRTIENKEGAPALLLYPNPVTSASIIRTNYSGSARIISSTGQEMITIHNAAEVALPELSAGIYILQTADGRVEKFVVR